MKKLLILIAGIVLAGCAKTIDGTTPSNYTTSVAAIKRDMSAEDAMAFDANLAKAQRLLFQKLKPDVGSAALLIAYPEARYKIISENLHGKTASDVKKMAREWDELQRAADIDNITSQIKQAKEANTNIRTLLDALDKVEIKPTRVAVEVTPGTDGDKDYKPYFDVHLTAVIANRGPFAIKSVDFKLPQNTLWNNDVHLLISPPLDAGETREISNWVADHIGGLTPSLVALSGVSIAPKAVTTSNFQNSSGAPFTRESLQRDLTHNDSLLRDWESKLRTLKDS